MNKQSFSIIFVLCMASFSLFAQERDKQVIVELDESKVHVLNPIHSYLEREGAGDSVYFGSRVTGKKVCEALGYRGYVKDTKVTEKVRAITTANLFFNKVGYYTSPFTGINDRLANDYLYPKGNRIKEVICLH